MEKRGREREKKRKGRARTRVAGKERAKMPTSAAILDRLHIIDRRRYPYYEQENIFQLLQKKTARIGEMREGEAQRERDDGGASIDKNATGKKRSRRNTRTIVLLSFSLIH